MQTKKHFCVLAQFETTAEIFHACEKIRDLGYKRWDSYSPFPIHGLDKAMGIGPSKLPWIVGATATIFGLGGFFTWTWMNAVDYKFVIAGKPFFSWPAYFLPGLECAFLSSAIACLVGMLALNKLPQHNHALFSSHRFSKVTDDKFFIAIESTDPLFHVEKTIDTLQKLGSSHIELIAE